MASQRAMVLLLFVGIFLRFRSSNAHKLDVGGKDGWVIHPSEDYSHWSSRLRFSVNDTLYFKYKKGQDSVLQVTREEYYKCNITSPILKMGSGSSYFKLARSGPYYFVSGVKDKCEKGQRLIVVVLSEHHHHRSQSPSPAVHPPATSPSHSRPTISPSPHFAPIHHPPAPAPASPSPKVSPTPAPKSPAPVSPSPKVSPAPSPASQSPKVSPTPTPKSPSPKVSPAPSPASHSPIVTPTPSSPSPKVSPAPSPEGSSPVELGPAADVQSPAPAPAKNSAPTIMMAVPVAIAIIACSFLLI
ncbi:hypothetical protein V2J09_008804 [Rumex salicifolius]